MMVLGQRPWKQLIYDFDIFSTWKSAACEEPTLNELFVVGHCCEWKNVVCDDGRVQNKSNMSSVL